MKTTLSYKLALLVLLVQLCCVSPLLAQFEIGLQAGRNYLESDAQCFAHTKFTSASWTGGAFGVFGRYLFNDRRFGARLNYAYLPLMFDERRISNIPAHITRAFSGTNKASDLSFELEWHLYRLKKFHPYLFAGLGAQFANYTVNFNEANQLPYLKALIAKDKTLPTTNFILPVGLGFQWRVSEKWALHLESSLRMPLSDYYDVRTDVQIQNRT
jgi:hypothetical protein